MIRNFFSRMMYGRYGSDQLNTFLLIFFWALWVLNFIISQSTVSLVLRTASTVLLVICLFRMMSRNYSRRRGENDAFLRIVGPMLHWFRRKRNQMRDKDHAYFKCPSCSQVLRVPKGKGKITVTCRNCGTVFQEKT